MLPGARPCDLRGEVKENRRIDPPPTAEATTPSAGRFGTFGGVFTPSLLTILGVVMYMRFGWVVGQGGLGGALLVVGVSHLISFATGLSVASIATNRTVGAGGAYYMISRSLGAPAGAAIGIPLFLGQALGVTFYIGGFTESVSGIFPELMGTHVIGPLNVEKIVGSVVCVGLTYLSIKSAELAIKAQYVVMVVIALSLVSFFLGSGTAPPQHLQWSNPDGESFTVIFSVFFPAVTGIMAGVSMSGDLKDPRRSIPRGTLLAITTGLVVYLTFPVWLSLNATTADMVDDKRIVWQISKFGFLITAGVWAATLSSALASILTAPRTLQALAQDGHVPALFGRAFGKSGEPVAGLLLTFALAETGVILGDLDAIAPVLTMFFLVTYGFTNLACGLERWAASPSFRPDFKVPAGVSLFGAVASFYVMSIISMPAMVAALVVCGGIYALTQRRVLGTTYGDARHGIWAALVRSSLHRLKEVEFHPLNWRPNVLIMGGNPDKRAYLLRLGSAIVQERGIVTYAQLVKGSIKEHAQYRKDLLKVVGGQISEDFPNVFYRVDIVEDVYRGIVHVAQSYGMGSLECNTVMMGWPHKPGRYVAFVQTLRDLTLLDRSLMLVNHKTREKLGQKRKKRKEIHIWWGGLERNGGLMLLLAFLLNADDSLRNASVALHTVVDSDEEERNARAAIEHIVAGARLRAKPNVIRRQGRTLPEIMRVESASADLAIVGFMVPALSEPGSAEEFFNRMNALLAELPTAILVHSARNFESEPVLFDS